MALLGWAFVWGGCEGGVHETPVRLIAAPVIVLETPRELGPMERPAAEFDHAKHTKALEQEGCKACHPRDEKQRFLPRLDWKTPPVGMDGYREAYHDTCITCHQKRLKEGLKTGPQDCGGCHIPRDPTRSARVELRFDTSLHARHVIATREGDKDKCETCHHTYNETLKKLEQKSGTEHNCWDCHGERDQGPQGRNLSRENAAHLDCINCHLKRKESNQKGGPWTCEGCHDAQAQTRIKKLDPVPRLARKQPDLSWVKTDPAATSPAVLMNHKFHETVTTACRECHHRTLKPCKDCHGLTGGPESGGVSLEQAYHLASSRASCVGCHRRKAGEKGCTGCHHVLTGPPGKPACVICHTGPVPKLAKELLAVAPDKEPEAAKLDPLPKKSDDFPETVEIKVLARLYQPSKMPHLKIALALDKAVRESKLASRFHAKTETLCVGCHHRSPPGQRVPPCRSCHGEKESATRDVPDLLQAYHRQCLGCHQQIGQKAQGCEDCHKKQQGSAGVVPQEVEP